MSLKWLPIVFMHFIQSQHTVTIMEKYGMVISKVHICHIFPHSIGQHIVDKHCLYDANMPTNLHKLATCFVLPANRSLVGILHNSGLCQSVVFYKYYFHQLTNYFFLMVFIFTVYLIKSLYFDSCTIFTHNIH
jgi:hypothetical protein